MFNLFNIFDIFKTHTGTKIQKTKRKKVGLALGSGDIRGWTHIGVMKTLLRHHVPIDYIAGASAGAVVGGSFAATGDITAIEHIAKTFSYRDLAWVLSDASFSTGLIKGQRAMNFLEKHIGKKLIESLSIPFAAVATNIQTGKPVILKTGDLVTAIRASSSIPLLFQPVIIEEMHLVDGGISLPVPVSIVRDMGADIVIAVNCYGYVADESKKANTLSGPAIMWSTINTLLHNLAKENVKSADVLIEPRVYPSTITDAVRSEMYIKQGSEATECMIGMIKNLL